MRIGILIKDFNQLDDWELEIIRRISNDPSLKICLLIKDGRQEINTLKTKLKRLFKSKYIIGKILFELQRKIESIIFRALRRF
jgi:hypothetical protein